MTTRRERRHRKAVIIGSGIAGPALAVFLRRAGIDAAIYEARTAPNDTEGAFLNLLPNGVRILQALGIEDDVHALGFPSNRLLFYNAAGKRIGDLNNEDEFERYGTRSVIIRRALLNKAMREAAMRAGASVEFGKRPTQIASAPDGQLIVRFEDGTEAAGDLIVGADGLNSGTREIVFPHAPRPEYIELLNAGGFARIVDLLPSATMHLIFGRRAFFGYQVVQAGEVYWFSNFGAPEPKRGELEAIGRAERIERLLSLHGDDPEPVPQILRAAVGDIGFWPTYDLPFLPTWHRGNVCLLGDAAHATSPSAGQGASMALEDALVLAKCLRDVAEPAEAFRTFESLRKERVEAIVKQARRNGSKKAVASPLQAWFRDRFLSRFLKRGVEANRWIYDYRVDWKEPLRAAS